MFKFIQKLYSTKKGKRTVVILNDDGTEEYTSHKFSPRNLWFLSLSIIISVALLVVFLMIFTPLGGFVYNQQQMRESVIAMQQQVEALQDSMRARNMQLQNLRQVIFSGKDSVFTQIKPITDTASPQKAQPFQRDTGLDETFNISDQALLTASLFKRTSSFPTTWPVEGSLTRTYNHETGHLGIDIAANKGAYFHAIANGVVIGKNWTLNYGYILYVQHQNNMVTIYKHASEIAPDIGDLVYKGDTLGRVGGTGIISSGPHLHMEIWANGVPQNPLHYLIKS